MSESHESNAGPYAHALKKIEVCIRALKSWVAISGHDTNHDAWATCLGTSAELGRP